MIEYNENILSEGSLYTVETNGGTIVKKVIYMGDKMIAGKRVQCWNTLDKKNIITNPSYVSIIVEENMDELNHEIAKQAEHAWEGRI